MKYSMKPTPAPADPKRSPQRAAKELAKKKALAADRKDAADMMAGKYNNKGGKDWTEYYNNKKK